MMQLQAVRVYCGDAGPVYAITLEAGGGGGRGAGRGTRT